MKKLSVFTVAAFACLCLIGVMSGEVFANGTETLGIPGTGDVDPASSSFTSMDIASGSGIVAAGKGFAVADQPVAITFTVPNGSTVKQVLLYWEGSNDSADVCDSGTIKVNNKVITGELIGGPFVYSGNEWHGLAFRSDITDRGMVGPGDNTLTVDDVDFSLVANGVGVLVIYEKASLGEAEISILDGHDFAYHKYIDPLNGTVPQTFTFSEASVDRTANLKMFFSSVSGTHSSGDPDEFRPSAIKIDIKHESGAILTTYWHDNKLDSYNGEEWDTVILDNIIIPPGATTLTVQAFSENRLDLCDSDTGELLNPASLTWVTAALSVSSPLSEECGPCDGKITKLTLQYNGPDANIEVFQKKSGTPIFPPSEVKSGDTFPFEGNDKKGTMGTEIRIYVTVDGEESETKLHTSCSQDIYIGLKFGDEEMFQIISGESRNGGPLCPEQ